MDRYRGAEVDTYISAEVMYGTRRGNSKVARLCELFIDIDCYEFGLTPDKAWEIVLRDYVDAMLPCPSLVVDSGQGLQLHWLLWEHPEAMPRWKRVERYLCKALRPLGADPIAIDAARVLRMAFTMNTKSGRIAEVIAVKDVVYTLDEIIEAYGIKSDDSITTTSANEDSPSFHAGDGQRDVEEKDDR